MISQTHKLDVVPGGITTVVHVKQYQTDESLVFNLFSRFGDFEISAAFTECTVRGTKSDGNGYSANATCDPSNNSVTVQLTEQMTAVAGRQPYEITVTDSTGRMITTTFILDVHRAALDADTVESESVIKEVGTIVEEYLDEGEGRETIEETVNNWMDEHPEATTTVPDGSITQAKVNNSYLPFISNEYATPQMYGAKADGTTDDSLAIQQAINSGLDVFIPAGTYKTTATIIIDTKQSFLLEASGATINYTGSGYAFMLQRVQFSTLKFGKIIAESGGCIKLYTERESNQGVHQYDYLTYCNIYFEYLSALTDCIYANSENLGWINENRFFGGRMAAGANGFRYYHNSENGSSHNSFHNVGVEGVTCGFNLSLGPRALNPTTSGKHPYFADYEFYGLRTGEVKQSEGKTIFNVSGESKRFLVSGAYDVPAAVCVFGNQVDDWTIVTPESLKIVKAGAMMEINQLELAEMSAHRDIASGTDLQTLTALGTYTCNNTATAQSLTNCPVQTAFNMVVRNLVPNKSYSGNNYYRVRELYPINTTGTFYRQVITSNNKGASFTYNNWYSFSGTSV